MQIKKVQIGGKKVIPFTIPSGIITTQVPCLEKLAIEIPELGVLTTKSIGPESRHGNKEPIFTQYSPGCFVNAVGLTNPGAKEFAEQLSKVNFPQTKFLLASIFGKNADEFIGVAKTLENYVDGFELNLSCPHAKEVGMALGQDPKIVYEIIKEVVNQTNKPIFAKLTPNARNIGDITKSAINAGAYGITAINTVGPGYHSVDGNPVLTNKVGGISGKGIIPIGLKCVKEIRQFVGEGIPIIGMGGISTARDINEYREAGANIFGIGSALAGMNDKELNNYFSTIMNDLENGTNNAELLLKKVDMQYKKMKVTEKIDAACDMKIIKTNYNIKAEPGQFVFAWIPEIGEKPFSIMDYEPLTLGILERGCFTKAINSLNKGDEFYIRGPYGQGINIPKNSNVFLVGGGCGIAGLHLPAKKFVKDSNIISLLAAKNNRHVFYLNEFEKYGRVEIATEDGSLGRKGLVTDLLKNSNLMDGSYFLNCGPEAMVKAVLPLELEVTSPDRVYSSIDYTTRCGVGICGSCSDKKGRRTCIEGPFMKYE